MITIEQRIELLKGGYTPEQIEKFDQPEPTAQPAQQAQQEPKQEQDPTAAPAAEPAKQEPDPTAAPAAAPAQQEPDALQLIRNMFESNKEVAKNMAQLTAAIQANALENSVLPGGANMPTAEEALASIIAPKPKERS